MYHPGNSKKDVVRLSQAGGAHYMLRPISKLLDGLVPCVENQILKICEKIEMLSGLAAIVLYCSGAWAKMASGFSILELINQLILIKRMYARTGAHTHGVLELVIRTGLCNIRPV